MYTSIYSCLTDDNFLQTGTLTESGLDVYGLVPFDGQKYDVTLCTEKCTAWMEWKYFRKKIIFIHFKIVNSRFGDMVSQPSKDLPNGHLLFTLASCHSLVHQISGNHIVPFWYSVLFLQFHWFLGASWGRAHWWPRRRKDVCSKRLGE